MSKLTPQQAREKHARRLKGATEDIRRGVQRVNEAPGAKAAQKVEKMRANLLAALYSGKWEERVAAVPLNEWKEKMLNKGVGRIAQGVDDSSAKIEEFFGELFEHQDQGQSQLDNMPDLTLEDNINRMTQWVRHMAEFKRRK